MKLVGVEGGEMGRRARLGVERCEHTGHLMNRERSGWLEYQVGHGAEEGVW